MKDKCICTLGHVVAPVEGVLALALILSLPLLCLSVSAQENHVITFDAPGADTTPGDFNGTYPSGINVWGVITGSYQDANSVFHGFLRSPRGDFKTFDAPGASSTPFNGTSPSSINDLGTITGSYFDANGFGHGFLLSAKGKFTSFDVPGVGGFGTTPLAINLEGAIVGYYTDSNFSFHAFLRTPDGKFTTWIGPGECTGNGSEGCFGSGASNINVFGIVVGGYEDNSGNRASAERHQKPRRGRVPSPAQPWRSTAGAWPWCKYPSLPSTLRKGDHNVSPELTEWWKTPRTT